jgi:transposase
MKKQDFLEFVKMDNLNSHKAIEVEQMISQTGARLLYLAVYSPEFNPNDMMWSVLKNFIRQFHDLAVRNIQSIIQASLLLINPSSFANWFAKCCYCTP